MRNKTKLLLISALSLCTLSAGVTAIAASANEVQQETPTLAVQYYGASIRYGETDGRNGIRFAVRMEKDVFEYYKDSIEETYTVITSGEDEAKVNTTKTWYAADANGKAIEAEGAGEHAYYQTTVYLWGIPEDKYTQDFSVKGYVKQYDVAEAVETTETKTVSMTYVANEAVKEDASLSEVLKDYLPVYTIEVYAQPEIGSDYEFASSDKQRAAAGTEIDLTQMEGLEVPEGYEVATGMSTLTGTVAEDGSLVLKVYLRKYAEVIDNAPMDSITSTATLKDIAWPAWTFEDGSYQCGAVAGTTAKGISFSQQGNYTVTFDAATVAAAKAYDYVELSMTQWENGWGMKYIANGVTVSKEGNMTFTVTFPTANWDGTMTVANHDKSATWGEHTDSGYNAYIFSVTGVCKETITVADYEAKVNVGTAFAIPTAKVTFAGAEVADKTVTATAKFNDVDVDITAGSYTATEAGTLVVTYACGDLTATATVEFALARTLIAEDAMAYVTNTKTSFTVPSWAQFGDYIGKTVDALVWNGGSEAAANQSLTFTSDFVTSVKEYKTVEVTVVFEGQDGAPIAFTANGVSTASAGNGVQTLTFATADWDGTISCLPGYPTWTSYYKAYVCNVVGLGVRTQIVSKVLATNTMDYFTTTATVQDVAWPNWGTQFGAITGTTATGIHFRTHTTYTVTFNAAFVEEAKKYDYVELSMAIYEQGWGIVFNANGTSMTEAGNKTLKFKFSTKDWDGTMTLESKNPTWGGGQHDEATGYNVHIFEIIAYGSVS